MSIDHGPETSPSQFDDMRREASAAFLTSLSSDEIERLAEDAWETLTPAQRDARTALFSRAFPDDIEARTLAIQASLAAREIDTEVERFTVLLGSMVIPPQDGGEAA